MSLGTTLPWRAQAHRFGVSGISLIPRGPRRWSRASSAQLSLSRQWMHAASNATKVRPGESITSLCGKDSDSTVEQANRDAPAQEAQKTGKQSEVDSASLPQGGRTDKKERVEGVDRAFETEAQESQPSASTGNPIMMATQGQRPASDIQPFTPAQHGFLINEGALIKDRSRSEVIRSEKPNKTPKKTALDSAQHDSVLVTPAIQYNSLRETQTSLQRTSHSVSRQSRLQATRQIKNQPLTNWRATLDILRLRTRPIRGPWQIHARKISVEPELAEKLLSEVDRTIWDIHKQTRCHIELCWPKDGNERAYSDGIYLLLSGDEEALDHATEEISRLAAQISSRISIEGAIGSKITETKPKNPAPSTWGRTWESSVESQRPDYTSEYTSYQPHEHIQKPQEWTPQTLQAYITAITNARLPDRLASKFYGSGTRANEAAIALINAAFADKTASKAYSGRAFKQALHFMELHGHSYRNHARELLDKRLKLNLPVDTDTFNIVLTGNVKVKDLYNFDSILKLMIRYGCLPNAQTWSLFLQLIESEHVRRHTIQIMHSLGLLLDPVAVRLIAKELVVYDIREAQDNWPGIREFLQRLDTKYGKHWVSKSAMNKMMNELGRLGQFASCLELFDIMAKLPSTHPTTLTLNTVLYHARSQRHYALSTAVLRRAHELNIALNEQSYDELFTLAFRLRKPNAMGLIWRYACLGGRTSWHMRSRVSDLIDLNPDWDTTKTDSKRAAADFPAVPSFHLSDMKASKGKGSGPRIAKLMFERFQRWIPEQPLHELLHTSWEVDNQINQTVKQAKQQNQQPRKITVPGVPLYLRRRGRKSGLEESERLRIDMTIRHLCPVYSHPDPKS